MYGDTSFFLQKFTLCESRNFIPTVFPPTTTTNKIIMNNHRYYYILFSEVLHEGKFLTYERKEGIYLTDSPSENLTSRRKIDYKIIRGFSSQTQTLSQKLVVKCLEFRWDGFRSRNNPPKSKFRNVDST